MKKTVKVVFKQNVDKHSKGDVAEVTAGYARNYLFKQNLAVKADDPSAQEIITSLVSEKKQQAAALDEIKQLAEDINGKEITIQAKAGEGDKLFGSITNKDIAAELNLKQAQIKIKPIKRIGQHDIEVDFGHGIKASVKLIVEAKK